MVASDIDALRTFLEHDRSALLVPAHDGDAFARALVRSPAIPTPATGSGPAARRSPAEFTWDAAAAAHERVYTELLSSLPVPGT